MYSRCIFEVYILLLGLQSGDMFIALGCLNRLALALRFAAAFWVLLDILTLPLTEFNSSSCSIKNKWMSLLVNSLFYQSSSVYVQGFCYGFKGFVCLFTRWSGRCISQTMFRLPFHLSTEKKALGLEFSCLFVIMWLMTPLYRSPSKPPVSGSFLPSAGVHCPCCLLAGLPVSSLLNQPLMQRFTALIQLHGGCSIILTLLLPVVAFILTLLFLW